MLHLSHSDFRGLGLRRSRVHLLLACMVKLNARLRTGKTGPLGHARQLALARAAHDVNEVARNALPSDAASFPILPGVHDGHFWVRCPASRQTSFCRMSP